MRIGFRAGEDRRVERAKEAHDECGYRTEKFVVGQSKNGRNKWQSFSYATNSFPLWEAGIRKDTIVEYWRDKPVRFAERNNCIGCFHRNALLLKLMSDKFPEKFDWFVRREQEGCTRVSKGGKVMSWNTLRSDQLLYSTIREHKTQLSLDDLDGFIECDSGYCGV